MERINQRPKIDLRKVFLEQRSWYPIFPSPSADFPIDYKYEEHFSIQEIPDILLVSSSQACFAYVINHG